MNEEELFCKLFPEYAVNGKPLSPYFDLFESGVEQSENRIKELEKKISVLFSCKNCPENKGGFICQKEYENKCLAQKIEFIKELQEENAELKEQISTKDILIKELQEQKVYWKESSFDWRHKFFKLDKVKRLIKKDKQLTKAKVALRKVVDYLGQFCSDYPDCVIEAEKILKEE